MQNNPCKGQRQQRQHWALSPFLGLQSPIWAELGTERHPVEFASYTGVSSGNSPKISPNTHSTGPTEAWKMRRKKAAKGTHPAEPSSLFLCSSTPPRSRPRPAVFPRAHRGQALTLVLPTEEHSSLLVTHSGSDLPFLGLPSSQSSS